MTTRRRVLSGIGFLLLLASLSAACQEQTHLRDVVYGHKLGVALTMDVFKPAKPNGIGVAWMVSGGWVSNHSSINPDLAKFFTGRGITVFQVVHGTQPKFTLPEIVQDIHRAMRYIRTNAAEYGADPNRIGISGGSAGGHLSLFMAAYGGPGKPDAKDPIDRASSKPNAVACLFPPTDFLNYGKDGQAAMDNPMLRVFAPAFGVTDKTPREEMVKMSRELSPIYGDLPHFPPTLIVHGDADMLVPIQQSKLMVDALTKAGAKAELVVRPGKAHGWPGIENEAKVMADWFEKHLTK